MRRILPLFLVLALGACAAACSHKSSSKEDDKAKNPTPAGEQPGSPGGSADPNAPGAPTTEELNTNPVEGVEPAASVLETDGWTDGPVWHPGMGVLFFTTPLGDGALYRMLPDGRVLKIRDGDSKLGTTPIGNAVTADGALVTVEAKRVVKGPANGGEPAVVAAGWHPGAPDGAFDTLKDVVARKDGTLYVTDPGYFAQPVANRIYRIDAAGGVQVVEAFDDVPRPNGIALSPDQKMLYVGFTSPTAGTMPFVRKYTVNDDGTLGEWTKFIDVPPADSTPTGLAVDKAGNVYVATQAGIEVYKSNGQSWGTLAIPEKPTGLAFGNDDLKTIYVTTQGAHIYQIKAKVAGIDK